MLTPRRDVEGSERKHLSHRRINCLRTEKSNVLVLKQLIPLFGEPVYVDAEIQTDLTFSDIEVMADCKKKLENKTQLKKDLFIEDICKNDQTVRFYTGIPSLDCLFRVFNFLKPIAEEMKYWNGRKKTEKEAYQVGECCFQMGFQTNICSLL